ncbi:DUF2169 domain-containing protein [Aquincola sp. S2]|uniref:DUF2169 domain-containing protein n=1 Tax=Pseudaquabacterium terrae TaxID=2732868 RepID=A0ABX2EE65_9BURK|nr:DUF2169 domain-containing protein [Aquabacterium terrae]NRF66896.1 DUF2169 domain-containing protein [Aquabacterium terrae]
MWSVDNKTAYAAAGGWIRDRDGAEVWIVAIKATYDILPGGTLRLADAQVPVHRAALPQPGLQSLLSDTDLGPPRPATDVLLVGCAHAPSGEPVQELDVAWRVGPIKRRARVVGDRSVGHGLLGGALGGWFAGLPRGTEAFERMPLTWERAQVDADANPIGCGRTPGNDGRIALPNVMAPGRPVVLPGSSARPIGFGPIASHWQPRNRHGGTYDKHWQHTRSPLLPEDLDPRHWQCAVPEQQAKPHLRGGEPVALMNLTPAGFAPDGRVAFTLPRLSLSFETRFYDGSIERSRSVIHCVVLDTHDRPRLSVVHHMSLPCHPKVNLLDRTIVREKRRPLDRPWQANDAAAAAGAFDGLAGAVEAS